MLDTFKATVTTRQRRNQRLGTFKHVVCMFKRSTSSQKKPERETHRDAVMRTSFLHQRPIALPDRERRESSHVSIQKSVYCNISDLRPDCTRRFITQWLQLIASQWRRWFSERPAEKLTLTLQLLMTSQKPVCLSLQSPSCRSLFTVKCGNVSTDLFSLVQCLSLKHVVRTWAGQTCVFTEIWASSVCSFFTWI